MYKAIKRSTYTGKIIGKEIFATLDEAILFVNSNISATGAYVWTLSSRTFIKFN